MKEKNVQSIIFLVIFFLFANQSWAADWIYYDTANFGDSYYDKSSIKKLKENDFLIWTKNILSEEARTKYYSILKEIHKAPQNPSLLCYYKKLTEIDCVNRKIKDIAAIFYDEKGKVVYSSPKGETGKWNNILPDTIGEKLINIVYEETVAPDETVVAAPAIIDKNLNKVDNKQIENKVVLKKAVRNLINKWLTSWESGDMETYRSCYASDFQSKGMNLDAWVSHKTSVYQKNKNINIRIDKLQITTDENNVTAEFIQHYNSSIFKYSGKKKLELKMTNGEWKIYGEIM